jgi:hypothetical protein
MADSDKNILITPNRGQAAVPSIVFTGQNNTPLTLSVGNAGDLVYSAPVAGTFFTLGNTVSTDIFSITDSGSLPVFKVTTTEIVANLPITGAAGATIMAEVSGLCDGYRNVFDIKLDQTLVSSTYIVDSKDLEVVVSGQQMIPYVTTAPGPWIPAFDAGSSRTFRVRENRLIIYNAPEIGSQVQITVKKTSATKQRRRYPFSPTTIALGD